MLIPCTTLVFDWLHIQCNVTPLLTPGSFALALRHANFHMHSWSRWGFGHTWHYYIQWWQPTAGSRLHIYTSCGSLISRHTSCSTGSNTGSRSQSTSRGAPHIVTFCTLPATWPPDGGREMKKNEPKKHSTHSICPYTCMHLNLCGVYCSCFLRISSHQQTFRPCNFRHS